MPYKKEQVKFEENPLISFVVPAYDIKGDVLKRCLMSLADQDYEEMEVIVVLDGPNEELKKVAMFYVEQSPDKFSVIEIEHAGACAARNAGFEVSKGEIVSFFNSDYILKPGMARLWVEELQNHPDCGFVYGAYQYASSRSIWYASKPFDKYQLEVSNYIDCGFPLWRKYVVKWDPECKSLQDWDFWIRVVKTHNIKGHYLGREISFIAELPRPKGLSMDSSSNWVDRVKYVKEKNGIPNRDLVVTSLGASTHGLEIAKILNADYRDDTIFKPNEYKALYLIGWYMKPTDQINDHPKILQHFGKNVKKILHFVGADIYWLRKFPYESLRYLAGALRKSCDHILCENALAQAELADYGIPSKIIPIPPTNEYQVTPLPDEFSVGIYLVPPGNGSGESDFDKYCYEKSLSIMRAMPDVKFHLYGQGSKNVLYPNGKVYGMMNKAEWKKFVEETSCLLRLVVHDTKPLASNEFMMAGRDVISNIPGECTDLIDCSGKEEINEWDILSSGLSAYRWPDTKKFIVQRIREIRDRKISNEERIKKSDEIKFVMNKDVYINRIRSLINA